MSGWYRLPCGSPIGAYGKSGSTSLSTVPELKQISEEFWNWDCLASIDTSWLVVRDPKSRMISATYQKLTNNIDVYIPDSAFRNEQQYFAALEDKSYWFNLIDNYFTDAGLMGPESAEHLSDPLHRGERDPWHIPPWDHYHTANYLIDIPEEIKLAIVGLENLNGFLEYMKCTPTHELQNGHRGPKNWQQLGIRAKRLGKFYEVFKECIVESRAWPKLLKYLEPEQRRYEQLLFMASDIYGSPEKTPEKWSRSLFP